MSMKDCSAVFPPTTVKGEGKNKRGMHCTGRANAPADPHPVVAPLGKRRSRKGHEAFGRWNVWGSGLLFAAVWQNSVLARMVHLLCAPALGAEPELVGRQGLQDVGTSGESLAILGHVVRQGCCWAVSASK